MTQISTPCGIFTVQPERKKFYFIFSPFCFLLLVGLEDLEKAPEGRETTSTRCRVEQWNTRKHSSE